MAPANKRRHHHDQALQETAAGAFPRGVFAPCARGAARSTGLHAGRDLFKQADVIELDKRRVTSLAIAADNTDGTEKN